MHCPSCGQQQVSNETKFCSRCGLPLGLVSEVLFHGGHLPQLAALSEKKETLFTRRNGIAFSVLWCLFFLLIMAPLWGILRVGALSGVSAIIGIFGGLMLLISSLIFLKKPLVIYDHGAFQASQAKLYGQHQQASLPPQQSVPIGDYMSPKTGTWRDTSDLEPTSVTEGTTKLLEKDEDYQ